MPTLFLHTIKSSSKTWFNRIFTLTYTVAISVLLLRHTHNLNNSPTSVSLALFLADFILGFLWLTSQSFHWKPIERTVFPENLKHVVNESEYPALDVFICTADPTKEPPVGVVNTALSVLAYEYPTEKLSVYVSDDGGSEVTLYAFMECAKFAKSWIPYCKKYGVVDRAPEAYFGMDTGSYPETDEIKSMYENMKSRVEVVVQCGRLCLDQVTEPELHHAFREWTPDFTRRHHPTVIQVSEDWFFLYTILFLGAYGKDFLDFVVFAGGSTLRWWNHQRMWLMWGLSSYPFALLEWSLKSFGLSTFGFNVTSKVVDEEQNRRYEQGVFEFGVESVLFLPISVASVVSLFSLVKGVMDVVMNGRLDEFFVQIFICGFVVVNSWPVYEGMVLRKDRGKMPLMITLASIATAVAICFLSSIVFDSCRINR